MGRPGRPVAGPGRTVARAAATASDPINAPRLPAPFGTARGWPSSSAAPFAPPRDPPCATLLSVGWPASAAGRRPGQLHSGTTESVAEPDGSDWAHSPVQVSLLHDGAAPPSFLASAIVDVRSERSCIRASAVQSFRRFAAAGEPHTLTGQTLDATWRLAEKEGQSVATELGAITSWLQEASRVRPGAP